MENKINLLATRLLKKELISEAEKNGVDIQAIPFIGIQPVKTPELGTEIRSLARMPLTALFSSANAVQSVISLLEKDQPVWRIYCLGGATRKACSAYFGESCIDGVAENAESLAALLPAGQASNDYFFFCGNQRREELPQILRDRGIFLQERIVYETQWTPHLLPATQDGILFFSPSAVSSYFSSNRPSPACVLFAIGPTTATAIRACSSNPLLVCPRPEEDSLLRLAFTYFHHHPIKPSSQL
jgi:uroporphyrinogen-III synthase